jgi:hypothetical protein
MKTSRDAAEALLQKLEHDPEALEVLLRLAELLAKRSRARRR